MTPTEFLQWAITNHDEHKCAGCPEEDTCTSAHKPGEMGRCDAVVIVALGCEAIDCDGDGNYHPKGEKHS